MHEKLRDLSILVGPSSTLVCNLHRALFLCFILKLYSYFHKNVFKFILSISLGMTIVCATNESDKIKLKTYLLK